MLALRTASSADHGLAAFGSVVRRLARNLFNLPPPAGRALLVLALRRATARRTIYAQNASSDSAPTSSALTVDVRPDNLLLAAPP
jgi:hypothetical protein